MSFGARAARRRGLCSRRVGRAAGRCPRPERGRGRRRAAQDQSGGREGAASGEEALTRIKRREKRARREQRLAVPIRKWALHCVKDRVHGGLCVGTPRCRLACCGRSCCRPCMELLLADGVASRTTSLRLTTGGFFVVALLSGSTQRRCPLCAEPLPADARALEALLRRREDGISHVAETALALHLEWRARRRWVRRPPTRRALKNEALATMRRAADGGCAIAQHALGRCAAEGRPGLARSWTHARTSRARPRDHAEAQLALAPLPRRPRRCTRSGARRPAAIAGGAAGPGGSAARAQRLLRRGRRSRRVAVGGGGLVPPGGGAGPRGRRARCAGHGGTLPTGRSAAAAAAAAAERWRRGAGPAVAATRRPAVAPGTTARHSVRLPPPRPAADVRPDSLSF